MEPTLMSNHTTENDIDQAEVKYDITSIDSGFTKQSNFTQLASLAAKKGGKSLQDFEEYCASINRVLVTMFANVNKEELVVGYNSKTGQSRIKISEFVNGKHWAFTLASQLHTDNSFSYEKSSDDNKTKITDIYVATLNDGSDNLQSYALKVSSVANFLFTPVLMAHIVMTAIVSATEAAAKVVINAEYAAQNQLVEELSQSMIKEIEEETQRRVGATVGKSLRIKANITTYATYALIATLIVTFVLLQFTKTTIWQLTVLNYSLTSFIWSDHLEHGFIKSGPADSATNQANYNLPAKYQEGDSDWDDNFDEISRAVYVFANEGALFGVVGKLEFNFKNSANKEVKYYLYFDIPYSGKNSVKMRATVDKDGTEIKLNSIDGEGPRSYVFEDAVNKHKIEFSLNARSGKQAVQTINNGELGWNYSSALTIHDLDS